MAAGVHVWTEAGAPKAGRVLVDESHSDWSAATRPFDTAWFGMESTYNYASFAEYLNHYFRLSINERAPLTPRLLRDVDVLLVKMPTRAFTPAERAALDGFVRRGGGLWLIGDHTNVFGTSVHLNALSAPMGLRFQEDATWDLSTGGPALWQSNGGVAPHSTLRQVSRFEFQTGCSLAASLGAEDLLLAPSVVARQADYGTPNFFPRARPNNFNGAFGPALLAAATRHGAGRVAAFTDSTSFSTFSMFARGRPELAVNTVAWLNRRNRSPWPFRLALLLPLAAAVWLASGMARSAAGGRWLAGSGALAVLAGAVIVARTAGVSALPPARERPDAPVRRVYLLAAGTDALFENLDPLYWSVSEDPERERRFTTFLIGTQRFGLVPTVVREVPAYRRTGDTLVIPRPRRPLPAVQLERLARFVREGGRALVLPDTSGGLGSRAALGALLRPFGLEQVERIEGSTQVTVPGAGLRLAFRNPFHIHGGIAVARDAHGREVLVRASLGRGEILVAGDGQLFANASLGNHFDVPSGPQSDAIALQFWMFRHVLLANRGVARCYPERRGSRVTHRRWADGESPRLRAASGKKERADHELF